MFNRRISAAAAVSIILFGCVGSQENGTPEGQADQGGVAVSAQALSQGPEAGCSSFDFGGKKYWFCTPDRNWQTARSKCQSLGTNLFDLATIESSAENTFIKSHLLLASWVGGSDSGVEGVWRWNGSNAQFWQGTANGSSSGAYANWKLGEPNNTLDQDCLRIDSLDGKWSDEQCNVARDYVCEGDGCPLDASKTDPGQCGCGNPDTDSDGDGTANCVDQCPNDANKTTAGACGCGNGETDVDSDGAVDCGNLSLRFQVPVDVSPLSVAVSGSRDVDIEGHATVHTRSGRPATIASLGGPGTQTPTPMEVDGSVGDVWSTGLIDLEDDAVVGGSVTTKTTVTRHSHATVSGTVTQNSNFQFKEINRVVNFVVGNNDLNVLSGTKTISPGSYRTVNVGLNATLVLGPGNYYFDNLNLNLGSTLKVKDSQDAVNVYIRKTFVYLGKITEEAGSEDMGNLLVGYFGTLPVGFAGPLLGTVIAPRAKISLNHTNTPHQGAVFANEVELEPNAELVLVPFPGWLVPRVTVSKTNPCRNESVLVTAIAQSLTGTLNDPTLEVLIDGERATSRYLQFPAAGPHGIRVSVYDGKVASGRTVQINVQDCGPASEFARVVTVASSFHPYTVQFLVKNAAKLLGSNRHFIWDFGDGTSEPTDHPYTTHSYEPSINSTDAQLIFNTTLRLVRDGKPDLVTPKTVSMLNLYAFTKKYGRALPPVVVTQDLKRMGKFLFGKYQIRNVEAQPITLQSQVIERHFCDPDHDPERLSSQGISLSVAGAATLEQDVNFPRSDFGSNTCGISLHLFGQTAGGTSVEAVAHFQTPEDGFFTVPVANPELLDLLNDLAANGLADPEHITGEDLERLLNQGRITSIPKLDDINSGALQEFDDVIGEKCDPEENDAPPRPGISCQVTNEWSVSPPLLRNALKGDLLLVASCGEIGKLLRQVDPRQFYSHEAIMTRNYYALAHSTADRARIIESIPKNPVGFMDPLVLQYSWPGSVNSSVTAAFQDGLPMVDPDGKNRRIKGFSTQITECQDDEHPNPPLVVHPGPNAPPSVREALHDAADFARSPAAAAHYRWFAYSFGNVAFDGADNYTNGNYRSVASWSLQQPATVSSVFVWWTLKNAGIDLEGNTLEDNDRNIRHAQFGDIDGITDGLYLYTEDERKEAGKWLYNATKNAAADVQEDASGPVSEVLEAFTNQTDIIAAQFTNCFAIDFCSWPFFGLIAAYQDPGIGVTASPDDFFNWDAPETGGALGQWDPLIYRSADYRRVHRWVETAGTGKITGTVRLEDGTKVVGALVTAAGLDALSDGDGRFAFRGVDEGEYEVRAEKVVNGSNLFAVERLPVGAGGTSDVTLILRPEAVVPPPTLQIFPREVFIHGTVDVTDKETIGSDQHGTFALGKSCIVSPIDRQAQIEVIATEKLDGDSDAHITGDGDVCVGDEVLVKMSATCTLQADNETVEVQLHYQFFEGDGCPNDDLDGEDTTDVVITAADSHHESNDRVKNDDGSEPDTSYADIHLEWGNFPGATPIVLPNVQPENRRLVSFTGDVKIRDDDWPDDDDVDTFPFNEQCFVDPFDRVQTVSWDECVDEVRVKIAVTCTLDKDDYKSVSVDVDARLFEGTSCVTDDKDGTQKRSFVLDPGDSHALDFTITNTDEDNDDDKATVNVDVVNEQQP